MSQLVLNLGARAAYGAEDFLVSSANQTALAWVDAWPDWPSYGLMLYGPAACGKTHLAHVWAEKSGADFIKISKHAPPHLLLKKEAAVLDDIENAQDEATLFHLLNHAAAHGVSLLLTAFRPAAQQEWKLKDLRSRLEAMPSVALSRPDDALLAALLLKHFNDRQLRVAPDVLNYLALRIERSFTAAKDVVCRLDEAALQDKRPITLPFVREVLGL